MTLTIGTAATKINSLETFQIQRNALFYDFTIKLFFWHDFKVNIFNISCSIFSIFSRYPSAGSHHAGRNKRDIEISK